MKKSLTLTIAVYNAVQYLEFILAALARQSMNDFEVIIADDGSGPEIKTLIDRVKSTAPFRILHLWHEDKGFRKNEMLNKAISAAQTDYLVFIDGDCVPHRHFMRDHWMHREGQSLLCGRRVNLSKQITEKLTIGDITSGKFEKLSLSVLLDGLMARSSNLEDAIRIESPALRRLLHRNKARILGCNFSVRKQLLENINGFDEEYQAPGLGEDTDIAFRLELTGVRLVTLRYLASLFHLYHPLTQVGDTNRKIFERVVAAGEAVCRNGIRHLEEHS